jgi:hypothetical protein
MLMPTVQETLTLWQQSLCPRVDIGGLLERNPTAHKWKATFRSLELREAAFWRIHDLLTQSYELHLADRALGARILLRSALETLATLIHLNQATAAVVAGQQNFHDFSDRTARLLLGSRDKSTDHEAFSIVTVLTKCEKVYPGISVAYASLSEAAHPNFEGMSFGYSRIDHDNYVSEFSNNMSAMYQGTHIAEMELCISTFDHEYNIEWARQFERLESWLVQNDEMLEAIEPPRV